MKKKSVIPFVGMMAILAFGSCKKEYTCECKSALTNTTDSKVLRGKKKEVKEVCEKGGNPNYYLTCHIK